MIWWDCNDINPPPPLLQSVTATTAPVDTARDRLPAPLPPNETVEPTLLLCVACRLLARGNTMMMMTMMMMMMMCVRGKGEGGTLNPADGPVPFSRN